MSARRVLTLETIAVGASARDKAEAIRQAGALLVRAGHVAAVYVDGMIAREAVVSTYLGNGVALPHGRDQDREHVRRPGLSVLQLPGGVEWDPGETAYLVIGLAAAGDEHMDLLANVSRVLDDPAAARELALTRRPDLILGRLTAEGA